MTRFQYSWFHWNINIVCIFRWLRCKEVCMETTFCSFSLAFMQNCAHVTPTVWSPCKSSPSFAWQCSSVHYFCHYAWEPRQRECHCGPHRGFGCRYIAGNWGERAVLMEFRDGEWRENIQMSHRSFKNFCPKGWDIGAMRHNKVFDFLNVFFVQKILLTPKYCQHVSQVAWLEHAKLGKRPNLENLTRKSCWHDLYDSNSKIKFHEKSLIDHYKKKKTQSKKTWLVRSNMI